MRVGAGADSGAGGAAGMGNRFESAMNAESGKAAGSTAGLMSGPAQMADTMKSLEGILTQMKELIEQLAQLIQAMSKKGGSSKGASSIGADGRTKSVGGSGNGGLGGSHGPSEKIPDPTEHVREITLGSKTMTIGGDGSSSKGEVDAAADELERMYDESPTFRDSIEDADGDELTVTLGRRDDNTSWGGGGRVFLNVNNIEPGDNDRFQGIVGHEFAHAGHGMGHGAELDSVEAKVREEA